MASNKPPAKYSPDYGPLEDRIMLSAAPMPDAEPAVESTEQAPDQDAADFVALIEDPGAGQTDESSPENQPREGAFQFDANDADVRRELVVIDAAASDYQQLVDDLLSQENEERQFEVVVLDSDRDGISQLGEILNNYLDLDAVHIISHGTDGAIQLGNATLDQVSLINRAGEIAAWRDAFVEDADLLLYGCDLASTTAGQTMLESLGALCDCDIAASDDLTGYSSLGGDWDLEFRAGEIESTTAFSAALQSDWEHVLSSPVEETFQQGVDSYTGTQDTYVSSSSSASSFGNAQIIRIDNNNIDGGTDEALLRFDNLFGNGAGQIPLGSTIVSARLVVYVTDQANGATVTFHRMLNNWSESSTWNSVSSGLSADDIEALSTADGTVPNPESTGFKTITGLEGALQAWSDGDTNYGWAILTDSDEGISIASSEHSTASWRPELIVDFIAPNTAPTTADNTVTTNEDTTYTFSAADFNYADTDGDALDHIQITALESAGALQLSGVDVTLLQTITKAQIDAGNLKFVPVANQNGAGYDSFDFRVSDGTDYSAAASTISLLSATFDANSDGFTYSDDVLGTSNPTFSSGTYEAAGGQSGGGLHIQLGPGSTGGATSGGWQDTFNLTSEGIVTVNLDYRMIMADEFEDFEYSEVVLLVDGVRYGSDTNTSLIHATGDNVVGGADFDTGWLSESIDITLAAGVHTITLAAYNNDATEALEVTNVYFDNVSVEQNVFNTMTVDVTAVNDRPTAGNQTVTTNEDVAHIFSASDFNFSDIDGDSLASVKITSLESVGMLQLSGANVTLNQVISRADIDAGNLTFVPVANANGSSYDSFEFSVNDGTADSVASYTMTIDVTAVNDSPTVATNTGATFSEGSTGNVITMAMLNEGDIDDSGAGLTYTVTSNPSVANGVLRKNGVSLSFNDTFTQADIDANLITYDHDGSNTTSDLFTFSLADSGADGSTPATGTFNFTITPVDDDAPTQVANTGSTVAEGGTDTIARAELEFTDTEQPASSVAYTVTASPANGQLELTTGPGVAITAFTQDDLNNNRVVYVHDGSETTTDSFTFNVDDGQGNAVNAQTFNLTITAVNDAPLIDTPTTQTTAFQTPVTFSTANGNLISVSDSDAGGLPIELTISAANGVVTLNGTTGLSFSTGDGTNDASMTFTGSIANINNALDGLVFTPDNGFNGVTVLSLSADDQGNSGAGGAQIGMSNVGVHVGDTQSLWLSTTKDVSGSGVTGIQNWSEGAAIELADPGLSFEPGTSSGTFTQAFDLDNLVSDGNANLNAVHYVNSDIRIGTGTTFDLMAGDILISTKDDETFSSNNTLSAQKNDVVVFRPDTVGNYSSGTFFMLLDDPLGAEIRGLTLVETDTVVGDITINAGDFLFSRSGGAEDSNIYRYETTNTGGSTSGTTSLLIDGDDIGNSEQVFGIELIETAKNIGGKTFAAGEILIVLNNSGTIGGNNLSHTEYDVVSLTVTQTTAGSGTTVANASLVVEGGDLNLDDGDEKLDALAFVGEDDTPPVEAVNAGSTVAEGGTDTISRAELEFTDTEQSAASVNYLVNSTPTNGVLELTTNPGVTINSFTQDDLNNNRVVYIHDGSNTTNDSFTFSVDDGQGNFVNAQTFNLTITPVDDDAPTQVANTGSTIAEGGTDTIAQAELEFTDTEQPAASVAYTVTAAPANGQLELTTGPGVAIASFTQDDLNNNRVVYIHDGSNTTTDSFTFNVDDGQGNAVNAQTFSLAITPVDDDAPTQVANTGSTIAEGGTDTIARAELEFTDTEQPATSVAYTVTASPANGQLELTSGPGVAITSYTQDDLNNNRVVYIHDGSNTTTDSFTFNVDDGQGNAVNAQTFSLTITPVDDDAPTQVVNAGSTIAEGGTDTIIRAELEFTDTEQPAASVAYTVTASPANGQLELTTGPGVAITGFTQDDLNNSRVVYIHDGSNTTSDSFTFNVDDGQGNAVNAQTFNLTITAVNDAPTLVASGGMAMFTEDGPAVVLDAAIVVADSELDALNAGNGNYDGASLQLVRNGGLSTNDVFAFNDGNGISLVGSDLIKNGQRIAGFDISVAGTLAISFTDVNGEIPTTADVNNILRQITYANTNDTPLATVQIDWTFFDGNAGSQGAGGNRSTTATRTVQITATNDDPTITSDGGGANAMVSVAENGTAVTTVTSSDPDGGAASYSIIGGADQALFSIDGVSGALTFDSAPDFETPGDVGGDNLYDVTVQVSDGSGGFDSQMIQVSVTDQNDNSPVVAPGQLFTISENLNNGDPVGVVTATDVDTVGALQNWMIVAGNADGNFTIDANTGQITILNNINLDFETTPSYTLSVMVDDGVNSSAVQTVQIDLTDFNESPVSLVSDNDATVNAIAENGAAGQTVGLTALANDLDGTDTVTYSLADDAGGRFVIDTNSGVVQTTGSLNFENAASHLVTVRATSTDGSSQTQSFTISVLDVNESPTVGSAETYEITSNQTLVATAPGVLANDSDVDGDSLTAVLVSDVASGSLTFNADGSFRYTPESLFSGEVQFSYLVTDGVLSSTTVTVAISVETVVGVPPEVVTIDTDSSTEDDDSDNELLEEQLVAISLITQKNVDQPEVARERKGVSKGVSGQLAYTSQVITARAIESGEVELPAELASRIALSLRSGVEADARSAKQVVAYIDSEMLWDRFDEIENQVRGDQLMVQMAAGSVALASLAFTTGYVFWTLKGGYLLASVLSQMPAWQFMDPLPIYDSASAMGDHDDEN